jgi:poly-gamma-glutamate capsule biosynthesis protein CapA/YwtB (metallophosphatase superfamily)
VTVTLALAGDTMLGRRVAERLNADPAAPLVSGELVELAQDADLFIVNLECCISDRGQRIAEPGKRFFFRAPPVAAERLAEIGVDCVTLANNHALDFGGDALLDTLAHVMATGITAVGAGADECAARAPALLRGGGLRLRVSSVSDHPATSAAGPGQPGIAYADLRSKDLPEWLRRAATPGPDADVALVLAHWGPNMRAAPVDHVRWAARALERAGATLIAGHSAHVPQGPRGRTLFDLGDFIDDYAVDEELRNDLGLLWFVTLDARGPRRVEAVPLRVEFAHTRRATASEALVLLAMLGERCAAVGTSVRQEGDRLAFATGG